MSGFFFGEVSYCLQRKKIHIGDKLAYRGSLSASLSQELIAAYRWLAYRVAYPVVASWRCGQRLGGGRRLAGRRRLGGGGGLATAALRSQLGVCLSSSLSFSLSRNLSMLIPGHRHYLYVSTRVSPPGLSNARNVSASGPVALVIFSY